jgi:DNA-binding beta-propeller fold protein YncE
MMTLRCLSLASLVSVMLTVACGGSNPQPRTDNPPEGPGRRTGARDSTRARRNAVIENNRPDVSGRGGLLVVANQQGASATILDASNLATVATVPVGTGPHEVATSPDGRWAVVTNYGDQTAPGNTVSVIDLYDQSPHVVRTIDLGQYARPHGAVFVQQGTKLLVTSETSQKLLLIDFISGRVDTAMATNGKGSHMVSAQRDGRRAWTSNITDGTVTEYDIDTRTTRRTYYVAPDDESISATAGGIQLWVGSNTGNAVHVVNSADATILGTIRGFGRPYRVGVSRTGRSVALVSDPDSNRVFIYDVGSRRELARIDLAAQAGIGNPATKSLPEGIAFDPIADFAYVTLHGTNQVVAIDLRSQKVAGFGSVGTGPDGIAWSPYIRR